jgi:hypothetical protein
MKFICPRGLPIGSPIELLDYILVETLWNEENEMQDKKKRSYEVSQKFQEAWALNFPWVEIIRGKDGGVHHVCCLCCSNVWKWTFFLVPKLNNLEKHAKKTKILRTLLHFGVKHGECILANIAQIWVL